MDNKDKIEVSIEQTNKNKECPICYEILTNYIVMECNHSFCLFCHSGFIENNLTRCPLCRIEIDGIKDNIKVYNKVVDSIEILIEENTALEITNKKLTSNNEKMIIVFMLLFFIFLVYLIILPY